MKTSLPLISVVLPVYNGMPFLIESVESIIAQTHPNWELVIVNDGSTDASADYMRTLAAQDSRIVYIEHAKNCGIAAAYNTGIANCRGRYIAFQEQDDLSATNRLEAELKTINEFGAALVSSRVGWIDADKQIYSYWPKDLVACQVWRSSDTKFFDLLIHQTRIANAATLLDRQVIGANDLVLDEQFRRSGQDWDLHLRLVRRHTIVLLAEPLVLMRRYQGHTSATTDHDMVLNENRQLLYKHTRLYLPTHPKISVLVSLLYAWSNELVLEARYYRGLRGLGLGGLALVLYPANPKVWHSISNALKLIGARKYK